MKSFASLVKLYIKSFYNLSPFLDLKKLKPAHALKSLGIALVVLLVLTNFGFLFVSVNLAMYRGLAMLGLQKLLFLVSSLTITVFVFVIGFMTALSTYYINGMENNLLVLPLAPWKLLAAKFIAVYSSMAAVSMAFMITSMAIFGFYEGPNPLFYLWGSIGALLLPMPPLALSYLFLVPMMSVAGFLRKRKAVMLFTGVLGLFCAIGFNMYFQSLMSKMADAEALSVMMQNSLPLSIAAAGAYFPAGLLWKAMAAPEQAVAFIQSAANLLLCLGTSIVSIFALAGAYTRSLLGFNEESVKRLSASELKGFLGKKLKRKPVILALVDREIKNLNREPVYLLNGPFVIILLPLIMLIVFLAQKEAFLADPESAKIMELAGSGFAMVIAAAAGAFLGSGSSIAATALSRDAKDLASIKSLPLDMGLFMFAKLVHAEVFVLLGSIVGCALVSRMFGIGFADSLMAFIMALAMASFINLAALWLDTARPKLGWTNPIAAMKQNMNSVIAIFGAMGLLGLFSFAAINFAMEKWVLILVFGFIPALATFAALPFYKNYAVKRLAELDL
ncbi:hypothetical protein MASR2M29_01100 [Spirochaetota bacterium]